MTFKEVADMLATAGYPVAYRMWRENEAPELRFTMFRYDYNDEEEIEYNGKYYRIYRTYLGKDDSIELYCERRKGNADH